MTPVLPIRGGGESGGKNDQLFKLYTYGFLLHFMALNAILKKIIGGWHEFRLSHWQMSENCS